MPIVDVNGQQFEFPDTMSGDEIKSVLKSKFPQQQAQPAQKQGSDNFSTYGVSMGVVDPIYGAGQLIPRGLSAATKAVGLDAVSDLYKQSAERVDKGYKQVSGQYEAQRENPDNFDWGRLTGNVISPMNWVVPSGGVATTGTGLGGKIAIGAGMGAGSAAAMPVENTDNYWGEKSRQAGLGAVGGTAAPLIGAAVNKVLNPAQDAAKIALEKSGVNLSLGQKLGGVYDDIEQKLTSVPFMGKAIQNRRNEALQQWNTSVLDDIVKPLGGKITAEGHEGINQVQKIASDAYRMAEQKMKPFSFDKDAGDAIMASKQMVDEMAPEYQKIYNRLITKLQTAVNGNVVSPSDYKVLTSEIGREIDTFAGAQSPFDRKFADVLALLDDAVKGSAKRQNPEAGAMMDAADRVYAQLARIEGAAKSAATNKVNTGVFTPNQLMSAVRSADTSVRKRATAGGDAFMQDVAQRGMDVLGNTVPDSGTAGRTAAMMGLLSGGGAAAFINPSYLAALGIGLGTGTAAYSKTGQKLANALLTKRPDVVRSAGAAAAKYAPYLSSPMAIPLAKEGGY